MTKGYTLDSRNARQHPNRNLTAVEASLRELGAGRSIVVDREGVIIGGNAVYEKARELGIPVREVETEGDELVVVRRVDLATDDPRRKALALADNEIATLAEWDEVVLSELLAEVEDIEFETMGFEPLASEHASAVPEGVSLAERFGIPPFSVLNAREGWWQARKKAWLGLGLQSEQGRGNDGDGTKHGLTFSSSAQPIAVYKTKNRHEAEIGRKVSWEEFYAANPDAAAQSGTSIFDPVLCELAYRWFCPPGGTVLDPFAGGSVRGIVAAVLGRRYVGIDLSEEQITANREQGDAILRGADASRSAPPAPEDIRDQVTVKISGAMLRQMFQPCEPDYIRQKCKGRCCQGTGRIMVTVHASETERVEALGAKVVNGFIVADERGLCPFKRDDGLCGIHGAQQPFGCRASPFTLNDNDTLVVRNRYRVLRCYKGDGAVPAYLAHAWSLAEIFGTEEAARIAEEVRGGAEAVTATMSGINYALLKDNDAAKHSMSARKIAVPVGRSHHPVWHVGDSRSITSLAEGVEADFVFSCPPYADLEVYSDDPADLSTLEYGDFRREYSEIVAKTCTLLKPDRFACFVVGEVRDKRGHYYDFVGDTVQAFRDAGLDYYNEAILVTQLGSLPIRVGRPFEASRKLGKTHQNVLVFIKGDAKKATEAIGPVEAGDPEQFAVDAHD